MGRKDPGNEAVVLANPKTVEYEVVRTSLLPGMLKTVAYNKKSTLPVQLFEVSDIVLQDPANERRTRNERRMCVLYSNRESGLELVHGVLDRVMAMLECSFAEPGTASTTTTLKSYSIRPSEHDTYFPGRQADVLYQSKVIGCFGILHPQVLEKFEINYPCSCLEINLEPFL